MPDDKKDKNPLRPNLNSSGQPRFTLIFFIIMAVIFGVFFFNRTNEAPTRQEITYSAFVSALERNQVSSVVIINNDIIEGTITRDGGSIDFETRIALGGQDLLPLLLEHGVNVSAVSRGPNFLQILFGFLPWLIGFAFIFFLIRNMQGSGNRAFQFGKSRAKRYQEEGNKITFLDVAGQKDAKFELEEVVSFLKDPQKFTKMGARIPRGVLLVGMPGTGKTLMARAVAGEADVAYFHMSGSDFVEMFVGVGASRVRDLFEQSRRSAPCIIFIDELDAVGRTR